MALTAEQQSQVDIQTSIEAVRHANQMELQSKQAKIEAIRTAKEVLVENARNKPVDSRDITASDVTAFANVLVANINA